MSLPANATLKLFGKSEIQPKYYSLNAYSYLSRMKEWKPTLVERWTLGFWAIASDFSINSIAVLTWFLWAIVLWDRGEPFGPPLVAVMLHMVLVLVVFVPLQDAEKFARYLARKARASRSHRHKLYWFSRFRHYLAKYAKRKVPKGVMVPLLVQKIARERGEPSPSEALELPILVQTLIEKDNELSRLKGGKSLGREIEAQVNYLEGEMDNAETCLDGYLRYLIGLYFAMTHEAQRLVRDYTIASMSSRVERYANTSRFLSRLVLIAVELTIAVAVAVFLGGIP